jgi:predicted metal-binding membrane protein
MSEPATDTGALLRCDRVAVVGLLVVVTVAAWAFTVDQSWRMDGMEVTMWRDMNMSMNGMEPSWTLADTALMFVMWSAMMAAMMVPGTAPMVAAFATIQRRRRERSAPHVPVALFVGGYVLAWAGFSAIATALQYLLQKTELLTTMMQSASHYFSAALFLAAGLYQFSPLKERCLSYCRSPDGFILSEWRDGALGAVVMGLRHGLFCMGCCAALMALLFAVAVMDLRWVAALTVLVTTEKLLPGARFWRFGIGVVLLAAGIGFSVVALRVLSHDAASRHTVPLMR